MKKNLTLFCLLYFFIGKCCYSQIEKGTLFFGGNISASSQNINSSIENNNISIAPTIGFFLTPTIAIGSSIGYSRNTLLFSNGYSVGVFAKKLYSISSNFYFTCKLESNYNRSWSDDFAPSGLSRQPTYSIDFQVTPSFIFFPTNKWGIEIGTGGVYYSRTLVLPNVSSTNSVGFGLSTRSLNVGFFYYLNEPNKSKK